MEKKAIQTQLIFPGTSTIPENFPNKNDLKARAYCRCCCYFGFSGHGIGEAVDITITAYNNQWEEKDKAEERTRGNECKKG